MSLKDFCSRMVPQGVFFRSLFQSSFTFPTSKGVLASAAYSLVNPRNHVVGSDCVSQRIPAGAVKGLNDEEILALFTSGFFGGFIFRLESWVLNLLGARILPARYTGFHPTPGAVAVHRASGIPNKQLLPVGSLLFNSFLLVDKHVQSEAQFSELPSSHVDFGYGSDEASFAGCHRFRITRLPSNDSNKASSGDGQVQIDLQGFCGNPRTNTPSWADKPMTVHYVYAKLLFANGIQALLARSS